MSVLTQSTELLTEELLQDAIHRDIAVFYDGAWNIFEVRGSKYGTEPTKRWISRDTLDSYNNHDYETIEASDFHKIKCWYLLPMVK